MMNNNMIRDFYLTKCGLDYITTTYGCSKAEFLKQIKKYKNKFPNTKSALYVWKKLGVEMIKELLQSNLSSDELAKDYELRYFEYLRIIFEVVDNPAIIESEHLALKIFLRATQDFYFKTQDMPKRIVILIAKQYVNDSEVTHKDLAFTFGVNRNTISLIFKRGIAENIFDDSLCEAVLRKTTLCAAHKSKHILNFYDDAFYKRQEFIRNQKISQLKALLDSDDPNINADQILKAIEKLENS